MTSNASLPLAALGAPSGLVNAAKTIVAATKKAYVSAVVSGLTLFLVEAVADMNLRRRRVGGR
jgi:hypothetical protein